METMVRVACPVCVGDGHVLYDGVSDETEGAPAKWIVCPTCQGKRTVLKEWADYFLEYAGICAECGFLAPLAGGITLAEDGGEPQEVELCYQCYCKLFYAPVAQGSA